MYIYNGNIVTGTTSSPTRQASRFQVDSPYQFSFDTCRKEKALWQFKLKTKYSLNTTVDFPVDDD